jgi:phage terminase Nu1 subunit (DNA packaging protein)
VTEQNKNQNLAEIARKKRYLHLIEKLHSGTALSKQEIKELEDFETEPLGDTVVKTIEEVARIMDVNWRTVYRWKREGMPVTKDGYYDLDEIKRWYDGRSGSIDEETEGKIYWETKLRKYKASLLELELKKVTGELLLRDEVEKGRIARIIAVKRAFLALPTRLAPVLAMKEPREIEVELYEAISEIIDEFAGVINDHKKTGQKNMDAGGTTGVEASGKDNSQPVG